MITTHPSTPFVIDGPAAGGSTDNAIVRWDGATGRLVQNSALVIADTTGDLSGFASGAGLTLHGGGRLAGADGKIGVGTTAPAALLHVEGGTIRIQTNSAVEFEALQLRQVGSGTVVLNMQRDNGTPSNWQFNLPQGSTSLGIRNAAGPDLFSLTAAGRVLLGTVTDSANGSLQLATHTTSAGGLGLGTVTSLFTAAAGAAKLERLSGAGQTFAISALGGGTQSLLFEGSGLNLGGIDADAGSLVLRSATGGATVVIKANGSTAATFDAAQNALFSGNVKSSSATGGIGYAAGAGGAVTQLTSKATGVTLNKVTGQIVLAADSLAANTIVAFVLTNTAIAAGDIILLNHLSGGTGGAYALNAQSAAGSSAITVRNITAGALAEGITIGFAVIRAVTT